MIVPLTEVLDFLQIDNEYFVVNAANNTLVLSYNSGTATNVIIPDGTYTGTQLAAAIQTAIDTAFTCVSTVTWSSTTRKFTLSVAQSTAYIGLSTDTKPSDINPLSTFYEYDTGKTYVYDGSAWEEK